MCGGGGGAPCTRACVSLPWSFPALGSAEPRSAFLPPGSFPFSKASPPGVVHPTSGTMTAGCQRHRGPRMWSPSPHQCCAAHTVGAPSPLYKRGTRGLESKHAYTRAKSLLSCPALCHPIDCGPPGSSIRGILQAGILEWVAIFSSRGSS